MSARDPEYMALVPKSEIWLPYERYRIDDPTGQAPGTIVVDTKEKFLYLVLPNKKAIRYGVAIGDEAYRLDRRRHRSPARPSGRTGTRRPR